ncbi:uncharacterized protein LOC131931640 [Physella acuta]|uniref:uncharacterized protein LOC131931640 n=1 Tax=Physella acuta TaxID=109671 RepID=UPI0027DBF765|nr:uncharacterized protein LOC131931640 [Physella acuta]XP_059144452.1 uncharacterized protein LOC131931640 [Physella acuta]
MPHEHSSCEKKLEILSYLPELTGKTAVHFIGNDKCFTKELAKLASKLIAVVNDSPAEPEKENSIEFITSELNKLDLGVESVDFIYCNSLLTNLDDNEVQDLFRKSIQWLKIGGAVFFKESCRQSETENTGSEKLRDAEVYEAFYSSVTAQCDSDSFYGFDLILSKSIDSCSEKNNDSNEMIWLIEKVKKDNSQNHGFKSFKEFLDNQQYSSRGILLYEKIFGRTFVSTGGIETTKEFVALLDLQKGQKVLDVGGGIGGGAFYMAKTFGVKVTSVDLSSNMTQIGLARAKEVGCGSDEVVFEIADATKREYPAASYDVVYSRDVILHIPDKLSLFKKFFKFLKPGGKVLISDYCCSPDEHSEKFKTYVKQRGYNLLSPAAYGKVLEEAGFVNVRAEDRTQQFADILKVEIARTESIKDEFIAEFNEDGYKYIVDGWKEKLGRVELGDQRWGLFYAEKP